MSELDRAAEKVSRWLTPLDDPDAPCGPDLEYDNAFLELVQEAAGKPETQFSEAQPPDWMAVRSVSEALLDQSRDLRLAIYWLRSGVGLFGWAALPVGLQLVTGLLTTIPGWLHPLPDPDDGDPYARSNALAELASPMGLLGDLRRAAVLQDRSVGRLTGREIELAATLSPPLEGETVPAKDALRRLLEAGVLANPPVRGVTRESLEQVKALRSEVENLFSGWAAPDLMPLQRLVAAAEALMPAAVGSAASAVAAPEAGDGGDEPAAAGARLGLSGEIGSRAEALRAIDMVCEFLERTEPSNPAPLFLRRARHLVNHNFLQLMKELAPEAMPDVARIVGVDPDSVEPPG